MSRQGLLQRTLSCEKTDAEREEGDRQRRRLASANAAEARAYGGSLARPLSAAPDFSGEEKARYCADQEHQSRENRIESDAALAREIFTQQNLGNQHASALMDGSDSGAGAGAGAFAVAVAAALKATDRPSTIIVVFSTSTVAGLRAAMLEGADHTRYVHVLGVAHNSFAKKMQASFPQTAQPWMHKDASDIDAILGTIDLSSVNTSHTAIRTALTNVIRINGTSKGIGAVKVMGSAGMIVSSKSAFEKTMTDLFPAPFRFPACIVVPASFFAIITSRGSVAFLCDTTTCNTAVTLQHIMKYTTTYLATL